MSKADTLVILSPGFPKDEADTTCIPPQQVWVRNLKRQFPQLNIIVIAFQYPYYSAQYQWNGIRVIALGGKNQGGFSRFVVWTRALLKLRSIRKSNNVIGVLSFWLGECTMIAARFARKHNLKYYCWILGQDARPGNNYVGRIKPEAENILAISDFVADEFNRNYKIQPAHIIPVGVDPAIFLQPTGERDIDILGAGSLIRLKRYDILINLIAGLRDNYPGIRAIICGKGLERELLKSLIGDLKLEDNVELAGELPHSEVLELMARTRVFLHPSNYEGFSTVSLEALYAGAQVVSFIKPMKEDIPNWHIAGSPEEMLTIVDNLLENQRRDPIPAAPYLAKDSARSVMALFGYNDPAIS